MRRGTLAVLVVVCLATWERTSADDRQMSASLDATAQGVSLVEWKTVSPLDGHTLKGSFRLWVGVRFRG